MKEYVFIFFYLLLPYYYHFIVFDIIIESVCKKLARLQGFTFSSLIITYDGMIVRLFSSKSKTSGLWYKVLHLADALKMVLLLFLTL